MTLAFHAQIHWPQAIYLAMWLFSFLMLIALHGRERTGKYNFWLSFPFSLIGIFILYWGGFFGG